MKTNRLGNGVSEISPEKHSACIPDSSCIAREYLAESSNDATVWQSPDFLAALGGLQQNASIGGSFTNILPIDHSLAIAYILSCRRDCQMVYVSPQITKLGLTPEAWLGKPDLRLQLVHEEDIGWVERALQHSRNTAEIFDCHYRLYDSCGKVRWFHDEASVVCDAFGAPLFIRGVMLDITEKKAMEAELHEHRYRFARNVEQRTEQLMRRIALLESCNATLCDKLALAKSESAAHKPVGSLRAPAKDRSAASDASLDKLSLREREILIMLPCGHSNKEIAGALHLAESTVKIHVQGILRKLNLAGRVQAAVYAAEHGLIADECRLG